MKDLILMVGLPRSGKTTEAFKMKPSCPIVSPDAIRLAVHGQRFLSEAEYLIWPLAVMMVKALFAAGHNEVIVDATNGTRKRRDFWKDAGDWKMCFQIIDTPADVCIKRAQVEKDEFIIPVIERMAREYEAPSKEEIDE